MKFLTPIITLFMLAVFTATVNAQTPTVSLLQRNAKTMVQPQTSTGGTLQTRSIAEIDRRIQALTTTLATLNSITFLSETEKAALAQKAQSELASLNALKQKVTANTDLLMLKEDAASVSASHRIFAFVFTQARILATADSLNTAANLLFDFAEKLEARIADAKTGGYDTTQLEQLLKTMKSHTTTAQTLTTSIMSTASSVTPDTSTGKATLVKTAKNIKQAAASLRAALQTGNQIRIALSQMTASQNTLTTPIGSSSATPAIPNAY